MIVSDLSELVGQDGILPHNGSSSLPQEVQVSRRPL